MPAAVFFCYCGNLFSSPTGSVDSLTRREQDGGEVGFAVPICIFTSGFFEIVQTFDIPNMMCCTWLGLLDIVRFK